MAMKRILIVYDDAQTDLDGYEPDTPFDLFGELVNTFEDAHVNARLYEVAGADGAIRAQASEIELAGILRDLVGWIDASFRGDEKPAQLLADAAAALKQRETLTAQG